MAPGSETCATAARLGDEVVTTALLLAAALALGQSEVAPAPTAPAPAPAASVVIPTAARPANAPAPTQPAPPAVSTEPQDQLEPAPMVRPFEMPAAAPPAPVPYADATDPKTPVKVEDYQRSYEGPKDSVEAYYDAGVRGAFQAEQALHGGLDGMWILSAADGSPLLSLVISDPGEGQGRLGGAWRDLARPHDPAASGLIDDMVREGRTVIVHIRLRENAPAATLRLTQAGDGRWRGQLQDAVAARAVVMERRGL